VLVWNLCGATDRKWAHLEALQPDVAVLPEVARQPRALTQGDTLFGGSAPSWHWVGINPAKGLAVATFGQPSGVVTTAATGRWSVAVRVGRMVVLGVWSCPAQPGAAAYAAEVVRALDSHDRVLRQASEVVVAGDFNVAGRGPAWREIQRRLAGLGLVSAYHHATGEGFGVESAATYYHHRKPSAPFHIDFCFVSPHLLQRSFQHELESSFQHVSVGSFDDWVGTGISDHVPVLVDLP
jgi:exonuclease III